METRSCPSGYFVDKFIGGSSRRDRGMLVKNHPSRSTLFQHERDVTFLTARGPLCPCLPDITGGHPGEAAKDARLRFLQLYLEAFGRGEAALHFGFEGLPTGEFLRFPIDAQELQTVGSWSSTPPRPSSKAQSASFRGNYEPLARLRRRLRVWPDCELCEVWLPPV